jgi:hypothetical protein
VSLQTPVTINSTPRDVARTLVLATRKIDLCHLPLGVVASKMAIVLDHFRIGMPEPISDLTLGCTAEEGLATEEVPVNLFRPKLIVWS